MTDDVVLHIYRKGELARDRFPEEWEDPEKLAVIPPHHRRLHLENPQGRGDDDPVRAFALIGNRVVGRVGLIPQEIWVEGRTVPVLWGFDLLVSTAFRGRGLATKLIRAWQDEHHTAIGTNVNIPSVGIYRKLKWVEFHTSNFQVIHRSRKFLERYLRLTPLAALAGPLLDAAWSLRRGLSGGSSAGSLRAEPIDALDASHDEQLARQSAPVVTCRSAAWVNWQLRVGQANEGREYRLFLVREEGGAAVGYFILQLKRMPLLSERFKNVLVGALRDWGIFDEEKVDALSTAQLAAREAAARGADVTLLPAHDEATTNAMRKLGYRTGEELRTLFHAVPPSPLVDERYRDLSVWRFTPAEADGLVI